MKKPFDPYFVIQTTRAWLIVISIVIISIFWCVSAFSHVYDIHIPTGEDFVREFDGKLVKDNEIETPQESSDNEQEPPESEDSS